ncbi:N2227-like protein-domain-containing protein [Aspergillus spinulosporus]
MLFLWLLLLAYRVTAKLSGGPNPALWEEAGQAIVSNITIDSSPVFDSPVQAIDHDTREKKEYKRLQSRLDRTSGTWGPSHPRHRLLMALYGFTRYKERNLAEVKRWRDLYKHVPKEQKQLVERVIGYTRKLNTVEHLFGHNDLLAREIVRVGMEFYGIEQSELDAFIQEMEKEKKGADRTSVVQAMKHFVRDWSDEGLFEREGAFKCILDYLSGIDRGEEGRPVSVLVPGAGAGRLGYEIDALGGFEVTINEWSAYMNLIYRYAVQIDAPDSLIYHPYIDWWSHHATTSDMQRGVSFPDIIPRPSSKPSVVMIEGDFTTVFQESDSSTFDIIVTLFFIDTARNLVNYLETIHRLLKPGGRWINLGPLLYGTGPWLQLSLDEIVKLSEALGFEFEVDAPDRDGHVCGTLTQGEGLDGKVRSIKEQDINLNHDNPTLNGIFEEHECASDSSILRRIDSRILPIMFLAYFLQFLDKVCLNKYPVTKVLGANIFIWGVILCCSAAVQNYIGLLALRVLLGMTEAVIAPALTIYTSMWYTPVEASPRFGLWYCGLGTGQILGGLISFGAQHASSSQSFSGWRIMFLVIGFANIAVSLLVLAVLPVSLETASFLSRDAKTRISHRLKSATTSGLGTKIFHAPSVLTTLGDPQTWLLCLLTILVTIPSGLIVTFSSILIKGFGYTSKESALLNMPSGLTVAPLILIFAWTGANFKGYTGKVTGCAFISAGFSIANIIGPQTFQARDAPDYIPAKITIVVANAVAIAVSTALRVLYGSRNREAERLGPLVSAKSWIEKRKFKLVFHVPPSSLEPVQKAIFAAGAGRYPGPGNYTECCWVTSGTGQFRPGDAANPAIGKVGELEKVEELRVETLCVGVDVTRKAVEALKK